MEIGKLKVEELERIVQKCWSKETSFDPDNWTPENPAWGQCAMTSLIVNDYLGGKIVRAFVRADGKRIRHYFNIIDDSSVVDLTRQQFPEGTKVPKGVERNTIFPSTRDYLLSAPYTKDKYKLLKARFEQARQNEKVGVSL